MWAASGVSWYIIHKYNIFKFFAKHLQVYFSNFNFITGVLYLDSMLTLCIAFTARLCLKIVKDSMSLTGTIIWVGSHLSAIGGGPCRVCKQKGNWELAIRNNEINCLNNTGSMGELDHILELLSFLCSVKGKLYSFQNKKTLLCSPFNNNLYFNTFSYLCSAWEHRTGSHSGYLHSAEESHHYVHFHLSCDKKIHNCSWNHWN